jgi:hypothetical protein
MSKNMKKFIYVTMSFVPLLASAQTAASTVSGLGTVITSIRTVLNMLIPVLIALAVVYFFWGLVTYIRASGDEKARAAGKSQMLWGIIAIAVMVSIFGLVAWLQNTLGIQGGTVPVIPQI